MTARATETSWCSSSYSNAEGGNCVEVAHGAHGAHGGHGGHGSVPVRDSKRPHGPALLFGAVAWSSFVAALKARDLTARERLPGRR